MRRHKSDTQVLHSKFTSRMSARGIFRLKGELGFVCVGSAASPLIDNTTINDEQQQIYYINVIFLQRLETKLQVLLLWNDHI